MSQNFFVYAALVAVVLAANAPEYKVHHHT